MRTFSYLARCLICARRLTLLNALKCVKGLKPTSGIKKFVYKFVVMPVKWISFGRRLLHKFMTPHIFYGRLSLLL